MTYYRSDHAEGAPEPRARHLRWTAQYQSKASSPPHNRLVRVLRRNLDLLTNSGTVFATTIVTSALGFVYWWIAARFLAPGDVGATSSAVATMTLISTIGVFGLGTLLVAEVQRVEPGTEWNLISTAATAAGGAALVGGLFFVVASIAFPSLVGNRDSALFALLLSAGCALSAVQSVVDDALVGLLAARLQLLRNTYMAVGKLGLLVAATTVAGFRSATMLLATWVVGLAVSFLALALHLAKAGLLTSLRPKRVMLQGKWRRALGHNALNLALYLPRSSLPIVVTALVSAHATAGFYTAWMIFMFLAMVPMSLSNTLYAITATDVKALRSKTRFVLFASAVSGVPAIAVLVFAAQPIMGLFGSAYSEAGVLLVWLCLTYPTAVLRNVYLAASRVRQRLRLATIFFIGVGLAEIVAAAVGATIDGVLGLTRAFALVALVEGVVLLPRVLQLAGVLPQRTRPASQHVSSSQLQILSDILSPAEPRPLPTREMA